MYIKTFIHLFPHLFCTFKLYVLIHCPLSIQFKVMQILKENYETRTKVFHKKNVKKQFNKFLKQSNSNLVNIEYMQIEKKIKKIYKKCLLLRPWQIDQIFILILIVKRLLYLWLTNQKLGLLPTTLNKSSEYPSLYYLTL